MSSKGKDKVVNEEGSQDRLKGKGQNSRKESDNEDNMVRGNVEGFIEERGQSLYYDEIEFLGYEYNVPKDEEASDVFVYGKQSNSGYDDDSDDRSYTGQSSSSHIEESLYDDSEVGEVDVEDESDAEEDGFGSESDVPHQQLCVLPEAECTMSSFVVGMTFEDKNQLKRAVDQYAISRGFNLRTVRSDRKTFKVVCQDGYPFTLYASTHGQSVGWQVKSLYYEHMCASVFENPRASTKWLADYFKHKVQQDPKFKSKEMKNEVQRDLKINVSVFKCKSAKKMIMEEMEGSFRDEFANLEAYCNELKLSNPGTDVSVEVSEEGLEHGRRIFKRMYVCFNASKVGWNEGCRPVIGVDGTFLKGRYKSILLTAVGVDGNDSLYPLALGLVERENAHHWSWFIEWLQKSLHLGSGENVTLMSDMQKGLVNAVSEVLPVDEHRFCARHIYANWSKKWRGNEFKKKFFSCAWSTYDEDFKDNLKRLGSLRKEAAEDVVTYNVQTWVRAYFSSRCKSWVVDNNMSESFNAWIDEYRFLPVIRMFNGIRLKMMAKWAESERVVQGWKSDFSPKCVELFESNRFLAADCRIFFNGDDGYEVVEGRDRHIVNIARGMCTCRAWDLTGIPCQHCQEAHRFLFHVYFNYFLSLVLQPGLNSEFVIEEGTSNDYMRRNADPETRFPIPNEREMRLSGGSNSKEPTGSRCIQFRAQSVIVAPPSDLPFQLRGLQWRGEPCVTSSHLLSRLRSNKDK